MNQKMENNILIFKHSGNVGDVIYSLPSIYSTCKENGCKAKIYLKVGVRSSFTSDTHPVGNVMMDLNMASMLKDLLIVQPYVEDVTIIDENVDDKTLHGGKYFYDLDRFRKDYVNLSAGNIAQWIQNSYPELRPNLYEPSIWVEPIVNNYIIVNRTTRYNNPLVDYSILSKHENVKFVGVESEFKRLRLHNANIEHLKVDNFLEMARYIAGCKLFIGNQSMAFAIAEQLKVKRILEQYVPAPNVIPQGGIYFITHNNKQFKSAIELALS